jgi:hypothetical protein
MDDKIKAGVDLGKLFNEIPVFPLEPEDPRTAELSEQFEEKIKFFLTLTEEGKRKFVAGLYYAVEYAQQ